jgi:hypothetical protein
MDYRSKEHRQPISSNQISQEALAETVGTTRPRVNFFVNRFKTLGLVRHNGELEVHGPLLNVVGQEQNFDSIPYSKVFPIPNLGTFISS